MTTVTEPAPARTAAAGPGTGALLAVTALTLSAFGPYVAGGIRTEQVLVYGSALLLLPMLRFLQRDNAAVPIVWAGLVLLAVAGWFHPPAGLNPYGPGSTLANLDNLLTPLVVMLLTLSIVTRANREALLRRVAGVTVIAMCLNTGVTLLQIALPLEDRLQHWWSSSSSDSVAGLALQNSRYTGIFDQPADAGICYSVALMCALFLLARRPKTLVLVIMVLAVGATLTVSKQFFLVGIPVVAWHFMRLTTKRDERCAVGVAGATAVVGAWIAGLLPAWTGSAQFRQTVTFTSQSPISALSGGRYGSDSTLLPVVDHVLGEQPLLGYGLPGLAVPYDSVWLETLVLAGLLGVLAVVGVYALLWRCLLRCRAHTHEEERRLFSGLLVIITVGSTGSAVLTANRVSLLVWLLLTLLTSALYQGSHASPSASSTRVPASRA